MADNGTQTMTHWPVPAGTTDLRPGTVHLRVHDSTSVESEINAAIKPLVDAGAYLVHAATMTSMIDVLRDLDRYDRSMRSVDESDYAFIDADSLLSLTAALYRTWATQPGRDIVYVVHDWIGVYTSMSGRDDKVGTQWLKAALTADTDQLFELTGLSYQHYTGSEPGTAAHPTLLLSTSTRSAGLNRPGGPQLSDIKGGSELLKLAWSIQRVEHVNTEQRYRTARVTTLKSRTGPAEPFLIQRPLHILGGWAPLA